MSTRHSDVETVLALEEPARAFAEAIEAAWPAIERLDKSKYAGIEDVITQFQLYELTRGTDELAECIKAFRAAQGDSGAFDYIYWVGHFGQTVGETAKMILDMNDDDAHMRRVESLRQYAATAAG